MTTASDIAKGKPAKKTARAAMIAGKPTGKVRAFAVHAGPQSSTGTPTIYVRIGRLLGESIRSELDIVRIVDAGLPASALDRLIDEVHVDVRLIGPETTVRRRMLTKQRFTSVESERLVRLARITSMAEELFGNTKAASTWLSERAAYIPDADPVSPLELSATDSGARIVEAMLLQTSHGIF